MEFQSKNLSSLLNSNKSIESYLSECTEYEKSNILEEAYQIDEGFGDWLKDKWQGFKHTVSSWTGHGNLQRHGKVFGGEDGGERGKAIDAQIASTESALKDNQIVGRFFQTLRDTYVTNKNGKVIKDYPNIRNEADFQNSTIEMAKLYDSIKAAALGNRQTGQPATIPIQQANLLIRQIRTYIDGLSKQLSDMYQYMTESDLKNYLFEQEEPLKGDYGQTDVMKAHSDYSVPKRLLKWGSILMAAGAAANGASNWIQQLEKWVPQNYDKWVDVTETITNPIDVTSNAHSVWGVWTDTGNRLGVLAPHGGVIKEMGDYQRIAEILGGGNMADGVRSMAQTMVAQNGLPKEAVEEMVKVITKAKPTDPAGNFANAGAKFGAKNLFRIYKAGTTIHSEGLPEEVKSQVKEVWTGMVQTTVGMTGGALALKIAGSVLTDAGISLVVGAAVTALMKYKGSKSSRAQLLQVCKDTFKDLNESEIEIPMKKDGGDKKPRKGPDGGATAGEDTSSGGGSGGTPGSGMNDNLFRKLGPQALKLFNDVRQNRKKFINAAANGYFKVGKRGKPIKMTPDQANQLIDFIKGNLGADRTGGSARSAGLAGTVDDHELSYKDPQAKQRSNFIKTLGLNQGDTTKSVGQNAFRKAVRQGYAKNDPATGKLEKWTVPELGIELTPDQYTKAKALQLAEELKKLKKLKEKILNELNSRTSMINESLQDRNNILKLQKQLKIVELHEEKINEQLTVRRWEKLSGILND
jgi:hypothetical protein